MQISCCCFEHHTNHDIVIQLLCAVMSASVFIYESMYYIVFHGSFCYRIDHYSGSIATNIAEVSLSDHNFTDRRNVAYVAVTYWVFRRWPAARWYFTIDTRRLFVIRTCTTQRQQIQAEKLHRGSQTKENWYRSWPTGRRRANERYWPGYELSHINN